MPADLTSADKRLEALWADLQGDETAASRALLTLADNPKNAIAFFDRKLVPLKIGPERVRERITELGSDKDEIWKRAFEELDYLDPRLAVDLVTLMDEVTDTPARQRLVALLSGYDVAQNRLEGKIVKLRRVGDDGFNFSSDGGSWWAEHQVDRLDTPYGIRKKKWTRASRCIVLLEHAGTSDAKDVLKRMATGHPDARPTKEAKAAVDRLATKAP